MLGAFVVLCVALVVAAILGAGKTGHSSAPSSPYKRASPVPLHRVAAIGGGWRMRVISVDRNANREVAAVPDYGGLNDAPAHGAQDFRVTLSLTYSGGGKGNANLLLDFGLHAMGVHNAAYGLIGDSCGLALPKPSLEHVGNVYSGSTVRGHVCFQIAKNDARTLMLFTGNVKDQNGLELVHLDGLRRVWFALR